VSVIIGEAPEVVLIVRLCSKLTNVWFARLTGASAPSKRRNAMEVLLAAAVNRPPALLDD
jgi:hypothetical protein